MVRKRERRRQCLIQPVNRQPPTDRRQPPVGSIHQPSTINHQPAMYVIVVYDVGVERVQKVCQYMRRYLPRVQNSVFEGESSEAKLERMKDGLSRIIDPATDGILIWVLRDRRWVDRQVVGKERVPPTSNFL